MSYIALAMDTRRWIYGSLDVLFALAYTLVIVVALPNRLLSAQLHLWVLPLATAVMAIGTLIGTPNGWKTAIAGCSLLIIATIILIIRIVISAAFLAGVYGAFGKAAASGAIVGVALLIEVVGLLPVVQLRWLRSRAGRRAFSV